MKHSGTIDVEKIGAAQTPAALQSVRAASEKKVVARDRALGERLENSAAMRLLGAELRQHVLDNLPYYLTQAEASLQRIGYHVHWAADADAARAIIGELCQKAGMGVLVKSKSMVTEEIELNPYLESLGFAPVETDLGEFVVQIGHDHPSHIVTPIIHINRAQVARLFVEHGLGDYTEDPEALTMQARAHMRQLFEQAGIGITGANFIAADTGRLVTVSNEGNLRFCASVPRMHIAITGIEKVVAREEDLSVLLNLLARSATGQDLTVYTQFLGGPLEVAGVQPGATTTQERHMIFIDNGRTNLLGSEYREMLRCIRCGACMNVCPVYRAVTGHGYGSVYPGPMGAILSPLLGGAASMQRYAYLPRASSLCGACEEVCPVAIPIPRMLLSLRSETQQGPKPSGAPPFGPWAILASWPALWGLAMRMGKLMGWKLIKWMPVPSLRFWRRKREMPQWPKQSFRAAWAQREAGKHQAGKGERDA